MKIKIRCFPESNYKSIYYNGKTIRLKLDSKKEITELKYPEFYDIKLTGKCNGNCKYCYQNSNEKQKDYEAVKKLTKFFSSMTENQRPFQIAYGGGEPTLHYQFNEIMKLTRNFDISPNYTTNGMFINTKKANNIIDITKKYCEGVAITCHNHLKKYWKKATEKYLENNVFLNFHNLIGNKKSIKEFFNIYKKYTGKIKYFVVLPLINQGRAKNMKMDYKYFFKRLIKLQNKQGNIKDIAFGANFYEYLKEYPEIKLSLYEPEIMSKYLDLKDMNLYKSSFNCSKPIRRINCL